MLHTSDWAGQILLGGRKQGRSTVWKTLNDEAWKERLKKRTMSLFKGPLQADRVIPPQPPRLAFHATGPNTSLLRLWEQSPLGRERDTWSPPLGWLCSFYLPPCQSTPHQLENGALCGDNLEECWYSHSKSLKGVCQKLFHSLIMPEYMELLS